MLTFVPKAYTGKILYGASLYITHVKPNHQHLYDYAFL